MNNLDVIILIVVGISALISLSRGLVKEVLSIIGWVLGSVAVIYLLPILSPVTALYIKNGAMVGIATSIFILIVFLVFWILWTSKIVGSIRTSKLGNLDRILGLFFGFVRAFLLVVLMFILISWVVPQDKQSPVFKESKYFQIAGEFAKPIESLIPESTLKMIREKTQELAPEEENEDKEKSKKNDGLFEKLVQPQIENKKAETKAQIKENFDGYKDEHKVKLDQLIDSIEETVKE